jgi:hypothetical protein
MGFNLDFIANAPTDEERLAAVVAKIEADLRRVAPDDPALWSRDDESPGSIMLLEQCVASGYHDLALEIVQQLSRYGQSQGGRTLSELRRADVASWHSLARPIWAKSRAGGVTQKDAGQGVKDELKNLVPGVEEIILAGRLWDWEEGRGRGPRKRHENGGVTRNKA